MLLLDEAESAVEDITADAIVCRGRIPADHPYAIDGQAPSTLGVELTAQAAALWAGLRARAENPEADGLAEGYLATLKDVRFEVPALPAGVALRARVRRRSLMGPLAVYEARLERADDGRLLLEATLSTFEKRVS